MSAAIFISYRRSDAAGHAGRLFDRLGHWFDRDTLFYDIDSIGAGDVFPQRLADGIESAKAVLVLIGPGWVDELNARGSKAEIDFVRSEVEHALRCHAAAGAPKVIPVLTGGAAAPSVDMLDASLRSTVAPLLALDMHAFQGKNDDWNHQFVRLRDLLETLPGVPAARFRVPAGAEPPPFHAVAQSVSRHFSDPDGRVAAVQKALEAAGKAGTGSPVAVHGMGGVGKTQLALKYSHDYRDRYAGVWWLRAETDSSLQLDALDACQASGTTVGDGEAPALTFKRWLDRAPADAPPWLLVFDNAEDPAALRPCLPERGGHHVLITSRNPAWAGIARPIPTGVWSAEQGADFLAQRLAQHPCASDRPALLSLAEALGGLPLALEQAAGFLDETGMPVADYLAQVHRHDAAPLLLDEGRAATGYERSVLATLSIAFPQLNDAAAHLLRLLAFCAPEPVPERLFTSRPAELPPALAAVAAQPVTWNKAVAALRQFGLLERTTLAGGAAALKLHRLTQEVARHRLADNRTDAGAVLALLRSGLPGDSKLPAHWPTFAAMAPHVLFIDSVAEQVAVDRRMLGWLLDRVASYFGYGPALYDVAKTVFERSLALDVKDLGEEHPNTLTAMGNLANLLWTQGDLVGARKLQERVLALRRLTSGNEHPDTLSAMGNLASTLWNQGELSDARDIEEQVLEVRRRVLGEEHPQTLTAMVNLASTLWNLGELSDARKLEEQVIAVRRRVLGEEHPDTLGAMGNLAGTLKEQGDLRGARELEEQVLALRCRVLGEEHPSTLTAMGNLAITMWYADERMLAVELMQRAVDGSGAKLGEDHPNAVSRVNSLATMRAALGGTSPPPQADPP